MLTLRGQPIWSRFLTGALVLYSGWLCIVSITVFVTSLRAGWHLKFDDTVLQSLMSLFFPVLVLGLWKPRITSGLLFAGVAIDLGLLLTMNSRVGDGVAVAIISSVAFLGTPMLGSALLFSFLSRRQQMSE